MRILFWEIIVFGKRIFLENVTRSSKHFAYVEDEAYDRVGEETG